MKILLFEPINQIKQLVLNMLIKNGFHVIAVEQTEAIMPELLKNNYTVLLGDFQEKDPESLKVLQTIRSNENLAALKFILHSAGPSRDFMIKMVPLGMIGFIPKPFITQNFLNNFLAILKKVDVNIAERKHVRVKPDPRDNLTILLRSPETKRMLTAKINDISMGGMAFEIFGNFEENDLKIRQLVKNIQVKIITNTISLSALIIAQKEKIFAIKYTELSEFDSNILSRYIYKRLFEDR